MKEQNKPYRIKSIQEEQLFWGLPKPRHPLVSVFRYSEDFKAEPTLPEHRTFGFYAISIKKNYAGKFKYGQRYYDFDSGVMTFISNQLNISPNYLSDMLRSITGQPTQQHIQDKLIEKAKEYLTSTNLSVSEIAYQLGFEYPQSFNKLFKKKTNQTPGEFKQLFN